jgi:hypothetical protein
MYIFLNTRNQDIKICLEQGGNTTNDQMSGSAGLSVPWGGKI